MHRNEYQPRLKAIGLSSSDVERIGEGIESAMRLLNQLWGNQMRQAEGRFVPAVDGATDGLNDLYRFISGYGESHDIFEDDLYPTPADLEAANSLSLEDIAKRAKVDAGICAVCIAPLHDALKPLEEDQRDELLQCWRSIGRKKRVYFCRQQAMQRTRPASEDIVDRTSSYLMVTMSAMELAPNSPEPAPQP